MNANSRNPPLRVFGSPDSPLPEVQLLSNGCYHVMVTNAGAGYSRYKELAVTRWHEAPTCDSWGSFCYVRDITSEVFGSNTYQPALKRAEFYEGSFSEGRAEFRRRDLDYETHTEIAVSSEDDVEVRRIHLANFSDARRILDITSYSEIVLSLPATDSAHPAFNKLFVETEIIHEHQAILCTRRPRPPGEPMPWMFHMLVAHGSGKGEVSYETDRLQFIGRGSTIADPQTLHGSRTLTGTAGPVLDPVAAIRRCLSIDSGETVPPCSWWRGCRRCACCERHRMRAQPNRLRGFLRVAILAGMCLGTQIIRRAIFRTVAHVAYYATGYLRATIQRMVIRCGYANATRF